jgi:uncharacterized membrane protein
MNPDTQFSKERIEMLCDGIFAIAMTLLVLELKVPELPKPVTTAALWHALRGHGLGFFAYFLSFMLAGASWMQHHVLFHYVSRATRALAILNLFFLMFVSLVPFSTSIFAQYGPQATPFYFGNQFVLGLLVAAQWLLAKRSGLLRGGDDVPRRRFATMLMIFPTLFGVLFAASLYDPNSAGIAVLPGVLAIFAIRKYSERRARAALAA